MLRATQWVASFSNSRVEMRSVLTWPVFSHAQWISLLLTFGVGVGSLIGVLPRTNVLLYGAPLLAFTMLLVRLYRLRPGAGRFELLQSRHVLELAGSLRRLSAPLRFRPMLSIAPVPQRPIEVVTTSLGLHLSADRTQYRGRYIHIYSLLARRPSALSAVRPSSGRLISRLQHNSARFEMHRSGHGVVHVLFAA